MSGSLPVAPSLQAMMSDHRADDPREGSARNRMVTLDEGAFLPVDTRNGAQNRSVVALDA